MIITYSNWSIYLLLFEIPIPIPVDSDRLWPVVHLEETKIKSLVF